MSIVTMKRLRLIALRSDRDALFQGLQELGCVQVDEPAPPGDDPVWAALKRPSGKELGAAREQAALCTQALGVLRRYGDKGGGGLSPRPTIPQADFYDPVARKGAESLVQAVCSAQAQLTSLSAEKAKLLSQRESLKPWMELEIPLDTPSTDTTTVLFGSFPLSVDLSQVMGELGQAGELCAYTPAGRDSSLQYLFFLCHKSVEETVSPILQRCGFSRLTLSGMRGTAAENDARLARELEENRKQSEALELRLTGYADQADTLRLYLDQTAQTVAREESKCRGVDAGEVFYLSGWLPAQREEALGTLLEGFSCAWETEEPAPEDYPDVPVKLKNGKLVAPMNMVTEMYALPAYGSVDPNPLMAPFFILFYGMMMADMGYGLVMMLISAWAMKRLRPKGPTMRYMTPLIGLCGVSTFIWGALTGGFFGDLIPQLLKILDPQSTFALPALFSPLDDAVAVLVGSLVLGLAQIFVGMGVSMYKQIKRGELMAALCNEGAWYLVFVLAGIAAVGVIPVKAALLAILALLILTQGYGKKGILGKLMGIGGSLYNNITGYFSDIMSYSRLMALMLAGAVVAQVFNQLGAMTGNVIAFFIIAMIGNGINFALNILGCYVHDMRLQCLEFFNRFYEDGGKPFRPLDVTTQYVDIVN